jgi:mRNA interferase RelE/StbE
LYSLKIKRKALKAVRRLPEGVKRRVEETLKVLQTKPIPARTYDIKKMRGVEDTYRIRIGDTRIVYTIKRGQRIIIIHYIGSREKAYKS